MNANLSMECSNEGSATKHVFEPLINLTDAGTTTEWWIVNPINRQTRDKDFTAMNL